MTHAKFQAKKFILATLVALSVAPTWARGGGGHKGGSRPEGEVEGINAQATDSATVPLEIKTESPGAPPESNSPYLVAADNRTGLLWYSFDTPAAVHVDVTLATADKVCHEKHLRLPTVADVQSAKNNGRPITIQRIFAPGKTYWLADPASEGTDQQVMGATEAGTLIPSTLDPTKTTQLRCVGSPRQF